MTIEVNFRFCTGEKNIFKNKENTLFDDERDFLEN